MPRPRSKSELLEAAELQFEKLWKLIDSMPEEAQHAAFLFEDRDKNLRDVLVHLYEWHQMTKRWHQCGVVEGGMPEVPGKGYTWKTLPGLNQEIWAQYQGVTLEEAKQMLRESHAMMLALAAPHSNEELFDKGVYKFTKSTNLAAYFIGCLSSHYEWAMKKIKLHIKAMKEAGAT